MSAGSAAQRIDPEPRSEPAPQTGASAPHRLVRALAAVPLLPLLPIAAFVAALCGLSLLKYRHYLYDDIDLAVFVQALARCLEGSTFVSIRGMSWLGDHASYVLFLLAPLYAVARHPATLLVVQSLGLGLGAVPVHAMALRALAWPRVAQRAGPAPSDRKTRLAAGAFATAYLLHPALAHLGLFEFHPEIVATTALLFAIDALTTGRGRACLGWSGLALLAREDVALVTGMLGLWAIALGRPRRPRLGVALVAASLAVAATTMLAVRPRFATEAAQYGLMYRGLGDTPAELLSTVARDPLRVLLLLVATPDHPLDTRLKMEFFVHLLSPLALLPLLAPFALAIGLPVLMEHMLSARTQQHTILYQYTALLLPALAWSGTEALRRLSGWSPAFARRAALAALACAIAGQAAFGPLGLGLFQTRRPIESAFPSRGDRLLAPVRDRMVAALPRAGGVIAGFEFLPRLADRAEVHSLHHIMTGAYTYSTRPYPEPSRVAAIIADWSHPRLRLYASTPEAGRRVARVADRNGLAPVEARGDLVRFGRGQPIPPLVDFAAGPGSAPALARIDGALEFLGGAVEDRIDADGTVRLTTSWRRVEPIDAVYLARLEVVDAAGRIVAARTRVLGYIVWPVADWPHRARVVETYRFAPDAILSPGRYAIRMRIARLGAEVPVRMEVAGAAAVAGALPLGTFAVVP